MIWGRTFCGSILDNRCCVLLPTVIFCLYEKTRSTPFRLTGPNEMAVRICSSRKTKNEKKYTKKTILNVWTMCIVTENIEQISMVIGTNVTPDGAKMRFKNDEEGTKVLPAAGGLDGFAFDSGSNVSGVKLCAVNLLEWEIITRLL